MKLKGTINQNNSSFVLCNLLGILITLITLIGLYSMKPLNIYQYIMYDNNLFLEVSLICLSYLIVFIAHELIHIMFFKLFSKNEAKVKLVKEKNLNAFVVKQLNPNVYYSKLQTIIILLSPLLLINSMFFILLMTTDFSILNIYANILANTLASCIDCYVSLKLILKFDNEILVNYSTDEINMNIYGK